MSDADAHFPIGGLRLIRYAIAIGHVDLVAGGRAGRTDETVW